MNGGAFSQNPRKGGKGHHHHHQIKQQEFWKKGGPWSGIHLRGNRKETVLSLKIWLYFVCYCLELKIQTGVDFSCSLVCGLFFFVCVCVCFFFGVFCVLFRGLFTAICVISQTQNCFACVNWSHTHTHTLIRCWSHMHIHTHTYTN